jgi:hypothetical protein
MYATIMVLFSFLNEQSSKRAKPKKYWSKNIKHNKTIFKAIEKHNLFRISDIEREQWSGQERWARAAEERWSWSRVCMLAL